jgi:polyhydroxybutyrate depolymerase
VKKLPDPDPSNGQTIIRYSFREKRKPEILLFEVKGGGHAFPIDMDVFVESWAFFKRELNRIE